MSLSNGLIYHAQELLEATLEACTHWSGSVYFGALPMPANNAPAHTRAELEAFRPYAIISTPVDGFIARRQADGEGLIPGGRLELEITENVPTAIAGDPAAVDAAVIQRIGKIISTGESANPGLAELRDRVGMLPIESIDVLGPARTSEEDQAELGDATRVWLTITWGSQE